MLPREVFPLSARKNYLRSKAWIRPSNKMLSSWSLIEIMPHGLWDGARERISLLGCQIWINGPIWTGIVDGQVMVQRSVICWNKRIKLSTDLSISDSDNNNSLRTFPDEIVLPWLPKVGPGDYIRFSKVSKKNFPIGESFFYIFLAS